MTRFIILASLLALLGFQTVLAGHIPLARRQYGGRGRGRTTTAATTTTTVVPAPAETGPTGATVPTTVPASTPPPPSSTGSAGTLTSDAQRFLDLHNNLRSQHGANPLVWNADIASKAQAWVNKCIPGHSDGAVGPYGENTGNFAGGGYTFESIVNMWADEGATYAKSPTLSHFTQMVWKSTTELGCAYYDQCSGISTIGLTTVVICEYSLPGNVPDQLAANVQA